MDDTPRTRTGIAGLDEILGGGLPAARLYLLEGHPGSGKTTLALQFLLHGAAAGEPVLYVTLSESADELAEVARSHGWDLGAVALCEVIASEPAGEQTLFHSWEIELGETVELIRRRVDEVRPTRVVFDSLSELRLLANDSLRYRRQILSLKLEFARRGITVLLVDDLSVHDGGQDAQLHSLAHGVIELERTTLEFGGMRRRLQVAKLRGVDYRAGWHDFALRRGGVVVYPRMGPPRGSAPFVGEAVASDLPELDALLGGGPVRGTSTLLLGPAGCGKTNLALQYVSAACRRGERCVIYEFDERIGTLLRRCEELGFDLRGHLEAGVLDLRQIDPAQLSPGEFASAVRHEVEQRAMRLLLIDSLSGYVAAMSQENQLVLQLHELLSYLNQRGVVTLMINAQPNLVGAPGSSELNVSHLADTVLLLRYFEAAGTIRKALSALKHRTGAHEATIRELRIDAQGLRVGEVLSRFQGVLTGVPEYLGGDGGLLRDRHDA